MYIYSVSLFTFLDYVVCCGPLNILNTFCERKSLSMPDPTHCKSFHNISSRHALFIRYRPEGLCHKYLFLKHLRNSKSLGTTCLDPF